MHVMCEAHAIPRHLTPLANTGASGDYNIFLGSPLVVGEDLSSAQCGFWDSVGYTTDPVFGPN